MEKKAIVIYNSKRGTTQRYAKWIAGELGCRCIPLQAADLSSLSQFDVIIYGGWLRGSGIVGFDKVRNKISGLEDRLIVFATGISEYNPENYMQICDINFNNKGLDLGKSKLFYCPGAYDPSKVTGFDSFLMKIAKRVLISGKTDDDTGQAAAMVSSIENGVDNVDMRYAAPVVKAAREILTEKKQVSDDAEPSRMEGEEEEDQ
jgi:flavodoxin